MVMQCHRCQREITQDESYEYLGQTLCDDCYLDARQPVKTCDPWAVYFSTRDLDSSELKGAEGLSELQKAIYVFVKSKGKVTREEVMEGLGLSETDLKVQLVPLMHSEMVKEAGEGGNLYLVSVS